MSSSKPETTIFLNDSIESMKKKIRKAHSGGQPTVKNTGDWAAIRMWTWYINICDSSSSRMTPNSIKSPLDMHLVEF